jgi:hypothetical protein
MSSKTQVSLSGGRVVTVVRGELKADGEKKKKSTKPDNHDITMACVCHSWKGNDQLAEELLKREAVESVSIKGRDVSIELSNERRIQGQRDNPATRQRVR